MKFEAPGYRLHKKSYGRTFLDSLPPAPLTTKLSDLKGFFKRQENNGSCA